MKKKILIVGSEGLIGQALVSKLKEKYELILIDKKKLTYKSNYHRCDLENGKKFSNLLKKIKKRNKIFSIINLLYPIKSNNFLQDNNQKFLKYVSKHLAVYYNFNKSIYDLFSSYKKKIIVVNFSSVYAIKVPNFNIYRGTKRKSPIEYSIAKAGLLIMSKYFDNWSKFKKTNINYICVSPAGIEGYVSEKFKRNYLRLYKAKMISASSLGNVLAKIFLFPKKYRGKNVLITKGAQIN
tara:strand:- start:338 stop:1051 length:714 start_codon:yes stop_codon:yes gene_type:complete